MTAKTEEPTDRAALRDRIAAALANADGWEYASGHAFRDMSPSTQERYDKLADAVLAVLPAPADRATAYRELADRQTQLAVADDLQRESGMATARRRLVTELRRMADEAPGPWLVQKICCGRDDGKVEFATWEEADRFREEYIDSARIASHERSAIVRAAADEAPQPEGKAPCTCADAGDCFAPAGHYADCPQAAEAQSAAEVTP